MKLYATVTSERATKGQGGKYLAINILDGKQNLLWFIDVEERNGEICLDVSDGEDERHVEYVFQDKKGKRQKGECQDCRNTGWCDAHAREAGE